MKFMPIILPSGPSCGAVFISLFALVSSCVVPSPPTSQSVGPPLVEHHAQPEKSSRWGYISVPNKRGAIVFTTRTALIAAKPRVGYGYQREEQVYAKSLVDSGVAFVVADEAPCEVLVIDEGENLACVRLDTSSQSFWLEKRDLVILPYEKPRRLPTMLPVVPNVKAFPELNYATTIEDVVAQTRVVKDPFKGLEALIGPTIPLKYVGASSWYLAAQPGDPSQIDLCFHLFKFTWELLENAADSAGKRLEVHVIDRQASSNPAGAVVTEDIVLKLDREYLEAHCTTGITIKVWGLRGEETFDVPAYYISGFLERLSSSRP